MTTDTPAVTNGAARAAAARRGAAARVLFVHPSDELYGADVVLLNLLRGLDRDRFRPLVVVANDLPYEGLLSRELAASGIECRKLPVAVARRAYLSPRGLPGFAVRLRRSVALLARIVAEEGVDLVVSNTLAVWPGALAARQTGRPHLWYVHELIERPRPLAVLLRRFVPAYSDRIICVSQ
ncbi:MAG: glycosyltransferase, partial [Ktedonobacterales bacterium]